MKEKQTPQPPRLARALLERRLDLRLAEVLDDMDDLFEIRVAESGPRKAWAWYWLDALNICVFGIGHEAHRYAQASSWSMYRNYLKLAVRHMQKHKGFAAINILGLAIGMAASLLILQYVTFERSYDQVPQAEDIYRVQNNYIRNGKLIYNSAATFFGVGPAMQETFPQVVQQARFYHGGLNDKYVVTHKPAHGNAIEFNEHDLLFADPSFVEMFGLQMVQGEAETALREPGTIVLSQSAARRYFGNADPIGQTLRVNNSSLQEYLGTVTGVFADPPPNRHVAFDLLISLETLQARRDWGGYLYYTYVQLQQGTDPATIKAGMPGLVDLHKPGYMAVDDEGKRMRINEFTLQSLREIHLSSHLKNEVATNGNGTIVQFLSIVALFILLIAWINYINLATARAVDRAREVGMRKVLGSHRGQVVRQFLVEALVMNVLAFVLALLLVLGLQPLFNQLTGNDLSMAVWDSLVLGGGLFGALLVGTMLAGLYPAFVLSSFKPLSVLKGQLRHTSHGAFMRKGLVIFQFVASIALIIGTFTVYQQLTFMQTQDVGFDMEQMVIIERPGLLDQDATSRGQQFEVFQAALTEQPYIKGVAGSTVVPGVGIHRGIVVKRTQSESLEGAHSIESGYVDDRFFDLYEMTFLAGRNFSRSFGADSVSIILNASAAHLLDFESPEAAIGQDVFVFGQERHTVIGVIEDYHHESLQIAQDPMYFVYHPGVSLYQSVKINTDDVPATLAAIEGSYQVAFPGNPFTYYFLDEAFNTQYVADQRFGQIFRLFAALAIFIACLGLYGLASFTTRQRAKEIGVRKVLGASLENVLVLISKDFLLLIALATLIAIPLAYVGLHRWLEGYAFRIELGWSLFLLPALLVMVITFSTIGFQTLKAATLNPVHTLRDE